MICIFHINLLGCLEKKIVKVVKDSVYGYVENWWLNLLNHLKSLEGYVTGK